jgi:hypothetical protein
MSQMGHDSMRAALIYQHATRDADLRIADAMDRQIEQITSADGTAIARLLHETDIRPGNRISPGAAGPEI